MRECTLAVVDGGISTTRILRPAEGIIIPVPVRDCSEDKNEQKNEVSLVA